MAIDLNAQKITPIAGQYVYLANEGQLHNVIVSSTQSTPITCGTVVTIDTASTNKNAPVAVAATGTQAPLGVVTYHPVKNAHSAGDRIGIARANDVVFMPASASVAAGATLYYAADGTVASTSTASTSVTIGTALTPAAKDELVQVELKF